MAAPTATASPLFLREAEVRRGIDLLLFGSANLLRAADPPLTRAGLGRAHFRVLHLVAHRPDMTVGALLALLSVTKQSLGRTVNDLTTRALLEVRVGRDDRRQRLLRLTDAGAAMEQAMFEALRAALAQAYSAAGPAAVTGFWQVLDALASPAQRALLATG